MIGMYELESKLRPAAPAAWSGPMIAVSRTIALTTERAKQILTADPVPVGHFAFDLGDLGRFHLTTPFRCSSYVPHAWRARGRLVGRGPRLARYTRVEVAIDGGPGRPVEVSVRPVSAGAHHWGARRLQRYLRQSHLVADEFGRRLADLGVPESTARLAVCLPGEVTLAA